MSEKQKKAKTDDGTIKPKVAEVIITELPEGDLSDGCRTVPTFPPPKPKK